MDPTSIRLELEASGDTLIGRASNGAGRPREFEGWLGLVAAIDALLPATAPRPRTGGVSDDLSDSTESGTP